MTAPLLVVRTRVLLQVEADDLRGTILSALANQPDESLRNEESHPELVLEARPAADADEAEVLLKGMEVGDEQHVKIVRLQDATEAELAAIERIPDPTAKSVTTRPPAVHVEAVGDALFIGGVKCCPFCFESYGSEWCECDLVAEFATAWPKDAAGQPLPAIFDLPGGAR